MGLTSISDGLISTVKANPIATAVGVAGAGVALGLGTAAVVGAVKSRKNKRSKSKRGRKRDRMFKSKEKHERRYKRKRKYKVYGRKGYINPKKKRSGKRGKVYYAKKTGQPYILLASGKAKFIKGKRRKK